MSRPDRGADRATRGLWRGALGPALAALCAGGSVARAETAPHSSVVEVTVIHASRSDGGGSIDPQLRDLPQLTRQQPFLRYNVYRLIDRRTLPLEERKVVTDPLVNGRTLQITLLDVVERGADRRFHMRAAIDEPGKQAFLKLLEVTAGVNEPFFVAGQSYEGGTLFLEIVVHP
jgi:hypothetical protein